MNNVMDNLFWVHSLECPPDACTGPIKKILCKGMIGLLWDDLSDTIFPIATTNEIRKNILLSKLQCKSLDPSIESMKNKVRFMSEKSKMDTIVSQLEEEYERQSALVQEKLKRLRRIKSDCSLLKVKKDILRLKRDQISTQLSDCQDMRLVCQHLMPSSGKNLNEGSMRNCLQTVANVWSGANKKQVWQTISNTLGPVETTVLWEHLQQNLMQDVNKLLELGKKMDLTQKVNFNTIGENMDVGIGTACGQHVEAVIKRLTYEAKARKLQERVLGIIHQIEEISTDYHDLSEWLALSLEVRKMEIEQSCLESEVEKIKKGTDDNAAVASTLAQIMSDIRTTDAEMEKYVRDVQQSLVLLKSAGLHINKIREKLQKELRRIVAIEADNYDTKWAHSKLSTELGVFYNVLDLSAVRKVMLKGSVGNYRHTKFCINEASIAISPFQYPDIVLDLSPLRMPIDILITCYKNLARNFLYKKSGLWSSSEPSHELLDRHMPEEKCKFNTLELFGLSKYACHKARDEIDMFRSVLNAWCTQHVQEISVLKQMSVDGLSFSDWLHQYSLLLYMVQNHI